MTAPPSPPTAAPAPTSSAATGAPCSRSTSRSSPSCSSPRSCARRSPPPPTSSSRCSPSPRASPPPPPHSAAPGQRLPRPPVLAQLLPRHRRQRRRLPRLRPARRRPLRLAVGGQHCLVSYPLVIAGILLLPIAGTSAAAARPRARRQPDDRHRPGHLQLVLPLRAIARPRHRVARGRLLSAACPVFDLVSLSFLLLVSARAASAAQRRAIVPLSLGMLGMVVGDTARA